MIITIKTHSSDHGEAQLNNNNFIRNNYDQNSKKKSKSVGLRKNENDHRKNSGLAAKKYTHVAA
jgi:hypothetical protein